jgi:hypothetical protein
MGLWAFARPHISGHGGPSMPTPRSGYIYFIGTERFGWYKIGRSYIPHLRVENIGVLLPFRVDIYAIWRSHDALDAEWQMHQKFSANRINGEWFGFDWLEVKAIIEHSEYPWFTEKILKLGDEGSIYSKFRNMEEDVLRMGKSPQAKLKARIKPVYKEIISQHPELAVDEISRMMAWKEATGVVLAQMSLA